jgi:hypothetical protein
MAIFANVLPQLECSFSHPAAPDAANPPELAWHHRGKHARMRTDRIEFISEYCDRWCERCAFTSRCSSYAVQAALGMCSDIGEAIELAVGAPMVVGASHSKRPRTFEIDEPTPEELRKIGADEDARDKLIEEASISKNAMSIMLKAHEWFRAHEATVRNGADAVLLEAIAIAHWDSCFIGAKLHRALHGRDRHESGDDWDADPIQNDWNGSAKIALISIERSESAWQTIAQATGDVVAAELAAAVSALRREVEEAFPFARLFTRPGFDDPHC